MGMAHTFDPNEPDDVYGDAESLERSCQMGAEQLHYLLKAEEAYQWLSRYTGGMGPDPQTPQELQDLEPEDEA